MNSMEERIWNYIDGTCSMQERKKIEELIESDPDYKFTYNELKASEFDFKLLDLEEPSMSFSRNVMEKVKLETAPGTFKVLVDKRIVYGIAAFFLLSIFVLLGLTFYQMDWSNTLTFTMPEYKLPELDLSKFKSGIFIKAFFFTDIVLGLYILDSFLRKHFIQNKINPKKYSNNS
ncbi:MAG: hypothetical protein ABI390_04445 [Daejeonella sp.]